MTHDDDDDDARCLPRVKRMSFEFKR